jgi:hypothetical protein
MKKILYFYGLASMLFFTTCKRNDGLFPYTQKGLNRASYMVDGKAYKIDNVSYGVDIYFGYHSKDSNLYGAATFRNSDEGVFFRLNDVKFQLGRIDFKIPRISAQYIDENRNEYNTTNGYIDIKYIDSTNKYKKIIAGEFGLTATNGKINKTVNITRGNFDTQYDIYP